MSKANPKLVNFASEIERLVREMLNAKVFMQRVHYAGQLQDTWLQMESLIEHFLKTDKSQAIETIRPAPRKEASIGSIGTSPEELLEMPPDVCSCSSQFRDRTLADGAAALLATHGKLHGTRIEQLLKEGGYRSRSKFFQNVLESAFKRDGRFLNLGGNVWHLKEPPSSGDGSENADEGNPPAPEID
jgi:hypothetical protein